jgi:hypothetical protein
MQGRPQRPCHKRAIHSSPERSRADNHGQRQSCCDLRRSPPSQVTIWPDLALGAGGHMVEACIGLAVPGRPIGPWSRRTGAPEGVRDQTRPDPRSARGPWRTGTRGARAVTNGHQRPREPAGRPACSSGSSHDASGRIRLWSRRPGAGPQTQESLIASKTIAFGPKIPRQGAWSW